MVFIFQTNINADSYSLIQSQLQLFLENTEWNFDFMDNQNILRVVPKFQDSFCCFNLMKSINSLGFSCVELKEDQ